MSKIIVNQIANSGGPTLTLPTTAGSAGQALTTDGAGNLSFQTVGGSGPVGQAFYGSGNGEYTWTCPVGVTSVSVVCIGSGSSSQGASWSSGAGGGGGLGWKNNIPVSPGTTYTVFVGRSGNGFGSNTSGQASYFINTSTVAGNGGSGASGGGYTGDGGGNGGSGGQYGGGGINQGGRGCVRIIWGAGRAFPSTGTGDM